MKKLAIAITAVAAFTGSAIAADMPVKAVAAPMVRAVSWTGCYVSAGWGYGMLDDERYGWDLNSSSTRPPSTSAAKGWLGAFGGGCDYQFNSSPIGPIVVGAFADYDPMKITGNFGDPWNDTHYGTQTMRDAWFAGARAGVLVTPTLLTFIDGGWTGAHIDQINILFNGGGSTGLYLPSQNLTGWFLGGGSEYAFTWLPINGLFWKNEYRFSSYESYDQQYIHGSSGPGHRSVHNSVDVQTITSSLVWRFWSGH